MRKLFLTFIFALTLLNVGYSQTVAEAYSEAPGSAVNIAIEGISLPWVKNSDNVYVGSAHFASDGVNFVIDNTGGEFHVTILSHKDRPVPSLYPVGSRDYTTRSVTSSFPGSFSIQNAVGDLLAEYQIMDGRGAWWRVNRDDNTSDTRLQLRSRNWNGNIAFIFDDGGASFTNDDWTRVDFFLPGCSGINDCVGSITKAELSEDGTANLTVRTALFIVVNLPGWPGPIFQ